jgi:hypothetical protein
LVSIVVPPIVVVFITAPVWPAGGPSGRAARTCHRRAEQHQGHDGHASDRRRDAR